MRAYFTSAKRVETRQSRKPAAIILSMRRRFLVFSFVSVALLACQAVSQVFSLPTLTPTIPATATATPTASPTPTQVAARGTAQASEQRLISNQGFSVRVHPDGGLYVGDQVSFEILAPEKYRRRDIKATLAIPGQIPLGPYEFGPYGIARRPQATLLWAWDTSNLAAGAYELTFSIQPDSLSWTETFTLLPQGALPPGVAHARWVTSESDCCLVYYVSGTEAERDQSELLDLIDDEYDQVHQRLPAELEGPVPIVFLPRVIGHGGFASQELSVSYLDCNYAGGTTAMVLHHEIVHFLDSRLGGELRPSLLVEGLAVYLSGGHFKPEALIPRAAALLDMGGYLPLASLADDFYQAQHESSYLLAGSLVEYMLDRWGWEAFMGFYRDIHPAPENGSQQAALNTALLAHFNLTLDDLEKEFLEVLRLQPVTPELRADVRLTIAYYDTVRRYQNALDPSAYYLTAWLPDGAQMRSRGIVADYLRRPSSPENLLIETLLVAADQRLRAGEYLATMQILESVNAVLDSLPRQDNSPLGR